MHSDQGEEVVAIEVLTYTPKIRPPRAPKPTEEILRFELHSLEEVAHVIEERGARDLRDRGAGPPPPGAESFSVVLERLLYQVRNAV